MSYSGYACAPYLHNQDSLELKDSWVSSKNIEKLYFVTGSFSTDSQPYFSTSANHYLLAKFKDSSKVKQTGDSNCSKFTSYCAFRSNSNVDEYEIVGQPLVGQRKKSRFVSMKSEKYRSGAN